VEAAEKYQQAQASADGKVHLPEFKPGDFVIQQERNLGSTQLGTSTKLNLQWSGPHRIVRRVKGQANIWLVRMGNTGRQTKRSGDLLRPIDPRTCFKKTEFERFRGIEPKTIPYQPGMLIAYYAQMHDKAKFRLGEIKIVTEEGNLVVQIYGLGSNEPTAAIQQRLRGEWKPLYINQEIPADKKSEGRDQYNQKWLNFTSSGQAKEWQVTLEPEMLLPIPPVEISENLKLKVIHQIRIKRVLKARRLKLRDQEREDEESQRPRYTALKRKREPSQRQKAAQLSPVLTEELEGWKKKIDIYRCIPIAPEKGK